MLISRGLRAVGVGAGVGAQSLIHRWWAAVEPNMVENKDGGTYS